MTVQCWSLQRRLNVLYWFLHYLQVPIIFVSIWRNWQLIYSRLDMCSCRCHKKSHNSWNDNTFNSPAQCLINDLSLAEVLSSNYYESLHCGVESLMRLLCLTSQAVLHLLAVQSSFLKILNIWWEKCFITFYMAIKGQCYEMSKFKLGWVLFFSVDTDNQSFPSSLADTNRKMDNFT